MLTRGARTQLLFAYLLVASADDAALQAGTHARLFCGGGELALVLALLALVDGHPARRKALMSGCVMRGLARFGAVSLTLWTLQWVNSLIVILFDELGGRRGIWRSKANANEQYTVGQYSWNVLVVLAAVVGFWWPLLWVWSKCAFAGSLERCLTRLFRGLGHASAKTLYLAGEKEAAEADGDGVRTSAPEDPAAADGAADLSCGQWCCCCCCCWKRAVDGVAKMQVDSARA